MTLYFNNLDSTLYSRIINKSDSVFATIYFPVNYDISKNYPVICFLQGGLGGTGKEIQKLKDIFGDNHVLLSVPLFKGKIDALKADSSNIKGRWLIGNGDGDYLWSNYKKILDSIRLIIPNYKADNSFLCGFSNGAHAISVLINLDHNGIFDYFNNFVLIGGGHSLQNYASLKSKNILFIQGDSEGDWLKNRFKSAKKYKANADYFEMKNTGHDFPPKYYYVVNNWINDKTKK